MKSTYQRNGTLNLFATLEIASGQVHARTTEQKKREDFRRFLDAVVAELPVDKEIHVILDNYCTHKKNAEWLAQYAGRVRFHFTPASASWLSQVEIWFGLLTRKGPRGASFANKDQLRSAMEAFVARTNEHPKPCDWRKREVQGGQLRTAVSAVRWRRKASTC
jgi:transposase